VKTHLAIVLILLLAAAGIAGAASQDGLTVAVYDFAAADKISASYASKVTAFVTSELTLETNLVMLARADLSQALREQAFGISGLVNSEAAAKIGQLTGAKVLVTGQVFRTERDHVVLVASIIGTETGRLFAATVEGDVMRPMTLSWDLSRKIAQTICAQATNLVVAAGEPRDQRLDRIVKAIKGKNRPAVSISIHHYSEDGPEHASTGEGEFGAVLLKAGFPVVDANSERKPDLEITGVDDFSATARRSDLISCRVVFDVKVQERRTGRIIPLEHQESTATDIALPAALRTAQADAVDSLAERILPLLAQ
jgi:Curli production assembly/transport component CsgG